MNEHEQHCLLTHLTPLGFFGTLGVPFWTTANAIETLANYMIAIPADAARILPYIENTFVTSKPRYCAW